MRELLRNTVSWLYRRAKSNRHLTSLYYAVRNSQGFSTLNIQEWMLADTRRVERYRAAIQKHIHPGQRVVDLGTGTGILSFLAAQQRPSKIHAIEHGRVIELAKQLAAANGFSCIEFANVNSRGFSAPEKVDVLLHEQIGNYCFDERMVENLIDLRERVLKPGGKILPNRFRWFIEPAMLREQEAIPFVWEREIYGIRFDALKSYSDGLGQKYKSRLLSAPAIEKVLSRPEPAVECDIETMQLSDMPKSLTIRRTIQEAGRMDGFCAYFEAWFDDDIFLSTEPPHSTLHWRIPLFRTPAAQVAPGDEVEFRLEMKDIAVPESFTWSCTHTAAARTLRPLVSR